MRTRPAYFSVVLNLPNGEKRSIAEITHPYDAKLLLDFLEKAKHAGAADTVKQTFGDAVK